VRLEASTKLHIHNLIHEFFINMAFTMACPNFKKGKGLKMVSGPLGIKNLIIKLLVVEIKKGTPHHVSCTLY
jgi:hypothetical protein